MNPNFLSFWDGLFRMQFDYRIHYGKWDLGGYLGHSFLVYSEEQKSFSVEMTATPPRKPEACITSEWFYGG